MKTKIIILYILTMGALFAAGLALGGPARSAVAQALGSSALGPVLDPADPAAPSAPMAANIPVQGRLTNTAGNPINGDVEVVFRIYGALEGGTALCEDTQTVTANAGLFSAAIEGCTANDIDGRQLYLGIQVGADDEMTPRQPIYPVPYAWSLLPGAKISGSSSSSVLEISNSSEGAGLWALSGSGDGVHGASLLGPGVYGYSLNGPGVVGDSFEGAALVAKGTGVITSTAYTYLWISGSAARAYDPSDTLIVEFTQNGAAKLSRGATAGNKTVVLPVTIPAVLYGQAVRIEEMTISWLAETDEDYFLSPILRQQTGACSSAACYEVIVSSLSNFDCAEADHATGCQVDLDAVDGSVLSEESGALMIGIVFHFKDDTTWINLGGVRLKLAYN